MNYGGARGGRQTMPFSGGGGGGDPFNISGYYNTSGSGSYPNWFRNAYSNTMGTPPGVVPPQGSGGPPSGMWGYSGAHGGPIMGGGEFSVEQTMDPNLTNALASFLQGQIGKGVTPFNLSTALPFGGVTGKGQLNAPANPLLQQLMQFFQTGQGGGPGMQTLSTIANQGISALPEWQSMIQAQQQNIQQNEANLKEQFGFMGNLAGTPYGNAISNYMQQTTADQNALLGQLQQQNILQGQLPAAEFLNQGATQFGQYAQGVNQQAIQNLLQEFIRTSPQNNPLLGLEYGMGTTFMPVLNRGGQTGGGILGGLSQAIGPLLTMMMQMGKSGGS